MQKLDLFFEVALTSHRRETTFRAVVRRYQSRRDGNRHGLTWKIKSYFKNLTFIALQNHQNPVFG
jgi:hypothetical protein